MKEFDFNSVGKRLPYSVPEGFFAQAKAQAKSASAKRVVGHNTIIYKVALAAATLLAICGAAVWLEVYTSPENQYERLLSEVSSDLLWEYVSEYDTDIENIDIE